MTAPSHFLLSTDEDFTKADFTGIKSPRYMKMWTLPLLGKVETVALGKVWRRGGWQSKPTPHFDQHWLWQLGVVGMIGGPEVPQS